LTAADEAAAAGVVPGFLTIVIRSSLANCRPDHNHADSTSRRHSNLYYVHCSVLYDTSKSNADQFEFDADASFKQIGLHNTQQNTRWFTGHAFQFSGGLC